MSKLELDKAREETILMQIKDIKTCAKTYYKSKAKLRKIYLKFDKVIDKKNFVLFLKHD
jgi:hypothetical protein